MQDKNHQLPIDPSINQLGDNRPTPPKLALGLLRWLWRYHGPFESYRDPCAGQGAFYNAWRWTPKDWCEKQRGRDFFDYHDHVDLLASNPPWGRKTFRPFMAHCFESADNVALLVPYRQMFSRARLKIAADQGFGLRAQVWTPRYFQHVASWSGKRRKDAGFAGGGLVIAFVYFERGYRGPCSIHDWSKTGDENRGSFSPNFPPQPPGEIAVERGQAAPVNLDRGVS